MTLSPGDYTDLARDYAAHRPGYAPRTPHRLLELLGASDPRRVDFADVGAGTGIWTRMVARLGCSTVAIEPNDAMRGLGEQGSAELDIEWRAGTAEDTGLASASRDLVTMASSLHWADFERATAELARVLRPGGLFAALWNTRVVAASPLLEEIEAELERIVPRESRVSSGRSAFCRDLAARLAGCGRFTEVQYLEDTHVEPMSPERYLGIWRSVSDVRAQAGEEAFAAFLDRVAERTAGREQLDAAYETRVWVARVPRSRVRGSRA